MAGYFSGMNSEFSMLDTRRVVNESLKPFFGPSEAFSNDVCKEVEEITKAELVHNFGVNSSQILQWELSTMVKIMFEVVIKCLTEKRDKNDSDLTFYFLDCFKVKADSRLVEDIENGGVFNFKVFTGPAYYITSIDDCIGTLIKRKSDYPASLRPDGPFSYEEYLDHILDNLDDPDKVASHAMVVDTKIRAIMANDYKQFIPKPLTAVTWCKLYLDNLIGRLLLKAYEDLTKSTESDKQAENMYAVQFYEVARPTLTVSLVKDENGDDKLEFNVFINSSATTRMNNKSDGSHVYEQQL